MAQKKKDPIRTKSMYAIPCLNEIGEYFFITFNTTDEKEALILASCVQGKKGKKALVIVTEHGDVYPM